MCLPPLIYLFSYLYQHGLMYIYFILWCLIQYFVFILLSILLQLTIGKAFRLALSVFWALPYFLALKDAPGSSYIFFALVADFFQGAMIPFIRELYLETRMWVLCVLTAIWCHFFQALSVTELVNRCVYTNPCIYTYL